MRYVEGRLNPYPMQCGSVREMAFKCYDFIHLMEDIMVIQTQNFSLERAQIKRVI